MDKNVEFLNYIYQNAQMGVHAVDTLLERKIDAQTREHLLKQQKDYASIKQEAFRRLHEKGHEEKDIPMMEKVMSYVSINVQTMIDDSPAHIAEMMMQGSVMGIIDITKNGKKYASADADIRKLGETLLKLEEDSLDQWKKYLQLTA